MQEKFTLFYNGAFSNWHPAPFSDENGRRFKNSEQYMMFHKSMTFNDVETAEKIMVASHPGDQKALGRQVKNFVRETWDAISRDVVYKGCKFKFEQNPHLKKELMATAGTTLVESSPSDKIWGIGLAGNDPDALDKSKWQGTNWLGEVLTKLRDDFAKETI